MTLLIEKRINFCIYSNISKFRIIIYLVAAVAILCSLGAIIGIPIYILQNQLITSVSNTTTTTLGNHYIS